MATSPERLDELNKMRIEFEKESTTDERRIEILLKVQEFAAEETTATCVHCKKHIVACPYEYALIEGHTYSADGEREYYITKLCEWCFDNITAEPEEASDEDH